jgi:hypothetical protein
LIGGCLLGFLEILFLSLFRFKNLESNRKLESDVSVSLNEEKYSRYCADHTTNEWENGWKLLHWTVINNGVWCFGEDETAEFAVDVSLEGVIDS